MYGGELINQSNVDVQSDVGESERATIRAEGSRPRHITANARHLLKTALAVDMVQPSERSLFEGQVLNSARAAGFRLLSVTVDFGVSGEDEPEMAGAIGCIGALLRFAESRSEDFVFVRNCSEIRSAYDNGKTGLSANLQDVAALNGNLDLLYLYRALGVTHIVLAYNRRSLAADGCSETTDAGLSGFGRALVKEMRKAGVLCDGSHTGHRSSMEAMELYEGPFIFSHSNCKSVFSHYRNITDEQIKACAATGGVIGINGAGRFLDDPYASAASMFRHIDHVVQLVGSQHVGVGLDRVSDPDDAWRWLQNNRRMWPDNNGRPHQYATFAPHSAIGEIVDLMLAAGYPEAAIRGYLGENFFRVLSQVEQRSI